jgi:hypothetical protein
MDASTNLLPNITRTSPSQDGSRTEVLFNASQPKTEKPKPRSDCNNSNNNNKGWRSRDRIKTNAAVLALCLHLGIDPPDIVRPQPGAEQLSGVPLPPSTKSSAEHKAAAEAVLRQLQAHFEYWQPRCHYRPLLDPPVDDLKRACLSARKAARDERVLFYYHGWGVPRPTRNGELWFFNANYTQYLPVNVADLDSWLGPGPLVVVLECAEAGQILHLWAKLRPSIGSSLHGFAAVDGGPTPSVPRLPGDLFTSSLTNPLVVALKHAKVSDLPGKLSDRSTLLGQLHWVFTALTDTLGWQLFTSSPRNPSGSTSLAPTRRGVVLFKQLYRQDVLLATLFRNYLLAQLVMRCYGSRSVSIPDVPWRENELRAQWNCLVDRYGQLALQGITAVPDGEDDFFGDHLEAFERHTLLLRPVGHCHDDCRGGGGYGGKMAHDCHYYYYPCLPIILQMLLSQHHRVRALEALVNFVDLDFEATAICRDDGNAEEGEGEEVESNNVRQIMDVGIYPYLLKLLHSPDLDARDVLAMLWLRILLYDPSTADDLRGQSPVSSAPLSSNQASLPPHSPPPWSFFVPRMPEDERDADVLLACLYLIGCRLGITAFGPGLEEDLLGAKVASPVFCSLLLGKLVEGQSSIKSLSQSSDLTLMVKMHLDTPLTIEERQTLSCHEQAPMRVFYVHWLARSKAGNKAQELEDIYKNDPLQHVRDVAEAFLEALRHSINEEDDGKYLSRMLAKASLKPEADIPMHLIRTQLLQRRRRGPHKPQQIVQSSTPPRLPTKLYEHFSLNGPIIDVAFDACIPGLLYVLMRDGTLMAYNYEQLTTVFEGFVAEGCSATKSLLHSLPRLEETAGFAIRTAGNVLCQYGYDKLPPVLIGCPATLTPRLVTAWRQPSWQHPSASRTMETNDVEEGGRQIKAEIHVQGSTCRLTLTGEAERTVLDIPVAQLSSSSKPKGSDEPIGSTDQGGSGGGGGIMGTLKQGIRSIAHMADGLGTRSRTPSDPNNNNNSCNVNNSNSISSNNNTNNNNNNSSNHEPAPRAGGPFVAWHPAKAALLMAVVVHSRHVFIYAADN